MECGFKGGDLQIMTCCPAVGREDAEKLLVLVKIKAWLCEWLVSSSCVCFQL